MENNASESYKKSIHELGDATARGYVIWRRQNPTTYFYESRPVSSKYITSIQRLPSKEGYSLQIVEADTKEVILDLNTKIGNRPSYLDYDLIHLVENLFQIVEASVNQRSADILNTIVKNIRPR